MSPERCHDKLSFSAQKNLLVLLRNFQLKMGFLLLNSKIIHGAVGTDKRLNGLQSLGIGFDNLMNVDEDVLIPILQSRFENLNLFM